jgi:hypothetical protein
MTPDLIREYIRVIGEALRDATMLAFFIWLLVTTWRDRG